MNKKTQHDPETAKKFFEQAFDLQTAGQIDRAAYFYRRSIEFFPTCKAHTFLGWVYSLKGLYEDAIEECRQAIKLNPRFGNPYNDIGAYLIRLKRINEAVPWLKKALNAPEYENYCYPYHNLGYIYEKKGNWHLALKYYHNAVEENRNYKPARTALDRLLGKLN
ncbi:MAG: tetratricopeptide repeat protein [Calditrichaceae bacterium]|nr:tetratricopeptide repeat protein [Calditrichaceae bacterium]MBN2710487.1 tetratricopeptide repeat protein [Calditrichaceae bacterium]RQV97278.1 MAG: tetratricopeptide repeat protein [Calditrichota bacterium]